MKYQKSELLFLIFFSYRIILSLRPSFIHENKSYLPFLPSEYFISSHNFKYQKSRLSPQQEIILQSCFNLNKKYNNEL